MAIAREGRGFQPQPQTTNNAWNSLSWGKIQRKVFKLQKSIYQLVYKLPQTRREEIERMFSLDDLRQTRVWQEAQQEARLETKLETAPRLHSMGLTVEQIAQALELTVEQVRQALSTDSN